MTRHLPHPSRLRRLRTTAGVIPSGAPTVLASILAVVMIGPPLLAGSGVLSSRGPHPVGGPGDPPASAAPAAATAAPTPRAVAVADAVEIEALVPRSPAPNTRNARTGRRDGTRTAPPDPTALPKVDPCQGERRGDDRDRSGGDADERRDHEGDVEGTDRSDDRACQSRGDQGGRDDGGHGGDPEDDDHGGDDDGGRDSD